MSRLTCLACGLESSDVAPTIVEYADPIPVTVHVPVSARRNAIEMPRSVPGRYGAEWRCRDVVACRRRAEAMQAVREPTRDAGPAVETQVSPVTEPVVVAEAPSETEGSWFA